MIMRPAWRSRTTPGRRWVGIALTFALVIALGGALMWLMMRLLGAVGAPGLVSSAPWWAPTLAAIIWAMRRPKPGVASEDGDESWLVLSVRAVMVGIDQPRPRPHRVVTAVLFGAVAGWGLVVVAILILIGLA